MKKPGSLAGLVSTKMVKNVVIVVLGIAAAVLSTRLVYVENRRYAMQTGLCQPADSRCLRTVETRTNPVWHLYWAFAD